MTLPDMDRDGVVLLLEAILADLPKLYGANCRAVDSTGGG